LLEQKFDKGDTDLRICFCPVKNLLLVVLVKQM